jgi:hypothetical protein
MDVQLFREFLFIYLLFIYIYIFFLQLSSGEDVVGVCWASHPLTEAGGDNGGRGSLIIILKISS